MELHAIYQREWMGVNSPPTLPLPDESVMVESQIDARTLGIYRTLFDPMEFHARKFVAIYQL